MNAFGKFKQISQRTFPLIFRNFMNNVNNNIISSGLPDVEIPNISMPEFYDDIFGKYEKHVAYECAETSRKLTFSELRKKSINLSRNLRKKLNLQKGDVVAVVSPNVPEYPLVFFGAWRANLIVTTVSPAFTADEISRQLKDASAKAVITVVELSDTVKSAVNLSKKELPIITIKTDTNQSLPESTISFTEFSDESIDYLDLPFPKFNDIAVIPYSSGTTGLPKGVLLTHSNLISNVCQMTHEHVLSFEYTTSNHQDKCPAILPMYHIYGQMMYCFSMPVTGSKAITLKKFTPDLFTSTVKKHNFDMMYLVPPLVSFLTASEKILKEDCRSLRNILCGAAPLGASDENRFIEKFGTNILVGQGYGLSETSPLISCAPYQIIRKNTQAFRGSIGIPIPNTLCKVVNMDDPNRTALPPNTNGELLVKGPQVMLGYLNREEETKKTLTEDGWLVTGDMAYYDDRGLMFISDRLKELIKVKGLQVAPAELEALLRSHAKVADAAVVGIPHERYGEVPKAFVVLKANTTVTAEELQNFVAEKVASYKKLVGGVAFLETIPKNPSGKILRRQLRHE